MAGGDMGGFKVGVWGVRLRGCMGNECAGGKQCRLTDHNGRQICLKQLKSQMVLF